MPCHSRSGHCEGSLEADVDASDDPTGWRRCACGKASPRKILKTDEVVFGFTIKNASQEYAIVGRRPLSRQGPRRPYF